MQCGKDFPTGCVFFFLFLCCFGPVVALTWLHHQHESEISQWRERNQGCIQRQEAQGKSKCAVAQYCGSYPGDVVEICRGKMSTKAYRRHLQRIKHRGTYPNAKQED